MYSSYLNTFEITKLVRNANMYLRPKKKKKRALNEFADSLIES
jgi:hypothetical protein